ncbi:MAG: cysteine--tRNA ligase [Thermoplasmata archaeon]
MRQFHLYDTLSRDVRLFVPRTPPKIGLFVCGLTPYDQAHIGHARTFVLFDVVARALRRWGYRVFSVQNVTNIDDRIIAKGGELNTDPLSLADHHFMAWRIAAERLRIRTVNYYPYATDYLPEIIEQVRALVDRGHAYPAEGSVYYDVSTFSAYGQLSGQRREALRTGVRVEVERAKRSPEDFVLWKAARPGEPWWESPWGPGRPGWHIEDTAITGRLLGPQYDIHGGGDDLKFPHHEAEIAQAEGATGQVPLVNFWMHAGMLTTGSEKMSKSVGNVVSIDAMLDEFGPDVLRFFYLNAQYRSPLDFIVGKSLPEAREAFERLIGPRRRLRAVLDAGGRERAGRELSPDTEAASLDLVERLDNALADDFNTREAIALLFGYVRTLAEWIPHVDALSGAALTTLDAPYRWSEEVLGLDEGGGMHARMERLAPVIQVALEARQRARARGDFAESDRIRDELRAAGVSLEDDGSQVRWKLIDLDSPDDDAPS